MTDSSSPTTTTIPTHDGRSMPAYIARPTTGRGPGLVFLHEIFGITNYIKQRARDLADLGYITVVPELFWRIGPNIVLPEDTQEGLQQGMGTLQKLDEPQAVEDAAAALEYLRGLPETDGRAGVFGFCMGGRLAYMVAAEADPDLLVSYYGSGIGAQLEDASRVSSPAIFHFGSADPFLPVSEAERIRQAFANHAATEVHMHADAGHAFDNPSPMFHHAAASREAWPQTADFLRRHLPPAA